MKVKVLPFPGSLSTSIDPSIISTSVLEIASPRPVPPYLRDVELSACEMAGQVVRLVPGHTNAGIRNREAQLHSIANVLHHLTYEPNFATVRKFHCVTQ